MLILGIETSCDETAAAVLEIIPTSSRTHDEIGGNSKLEILSNVVSSQIKIHQKYKGIVPEVAARAHFEKILPVLLASLATPARFAGASARRECSAKASLASPNETFARRRDSLDKDQGKTPAVKKMKEIDLIAVTYGPGLVTSLLVGLEAAKTLSYIFKKPLIPVNHLEGHIYANWLPSSSEFLKFQNKQIFPSVCLIVSGGHTELLLMKDYGRYQRLGGTRDDAAGECFDKVAKLLNLGYPGGPAIEKIAKLGSPTAYGSRAPIVLPRPMISSPDFDFSFSGLKTAVLYLIRNSVELHLLKSHRAISPNGLTLSGRQNSFKISNGVNKTRDFKISKGFVKALAYETQESIVDVLIAKTIKAVKRFKAKSVILGGGVAANQQLRDQMKEEVEKIGKIFLVPPKNFCTDNAAMIALAGYFNYRFLNTRQKKRLLYNWQKIEADPNLML